MFTELSGITEETGLSFDGESRLYGYIETVGIVVSDIADKGEYRIDMFVSANCAAPENAGRITPLVNSLAEGLPKNTVMSQSCADRYIRVVLNKYELLQENIVYLTEFLRKLAFGIEELGFEGDDYKVLYDIEPKSDAELPKDAVRIKLGFDLRSMAGAVGAVIGAAAMVVIAILTVNADIEITAFGLRFEISTYILSALTAIVVFADYSFIARKLDAFGSVICPVLVCAAVVLSGFGTSVKACARAEQISFMQALRTLPELLMKYPDVESFMFGYITRGLVLAAVACVFIYIFYFSRHPDETIKPEKIITKDDKPADKS